MILVITVNLKVAVRVDLKSSHHEKNIFVTMYGDEC